VRAARRERVGWIRREAISKPTPRFGESVEVAGEAIAEINHRMDGK